MLLEKDVVMVSCGAAAKRTYESPAGERHGGAAAWRNEDRQAGALAREWVRLALTSRAVGLCLVDGQGRARRSNRTFETLVGYDEAELGRLPFTVYTDEADTAFNLELWQRLRQDDISGYSLVKRYRPKAGQPFDARLTVFRDRDSICSIVDPAREWHAPLASGPVTVVVGASGGEPVIEIERLGDDIAVVRLLGEHDLASAPDVAAALTEVSGEGRTPLVDVSDTEYIDSAVVNVLFRARSELVLVVGTTSVVRRVLELTGLLEAVPVVSTVAVAADRNRRRRPPA